MTRIEKLLCQVNIPTVGSMSFVGCVDPPPVERGSDASPTDTVSFSNLAKRFAGFMQIDCFLKGPFSWACHKVFVLMSGLRHQLKISYGVVKPISINVMNNFMWVQFSPKMLLHYMPVLKQLLARPVNHDSYESVFGFSAKRSDVATFVFSTHTQPSK